MMKVGILREILSRYPDDTIFNLMVEVRNKELVDTYGQVDASAFLDDRGREPRLTVGIRLFNLAEERKNINSKPTKAMNKINATNNDYVTFPTAKLLREAGYPQDRVYCSHYDDNGDLMPSKYDCASVKDAVVAPHLWDAMKWLRGEKRISVEVTCIYSTEYCVDVYVITDVFCDEATLIKGDAPFTPTYEAACDAGIKAACEWLIAHLTNDESKN